MSNVLSLKEDEMKIKQIHMLDIEKEGNGFKYTYGIFATSFFSKKYLKCVFKSQVPHFWWTEIQQSMISSGIYFEDLLDGRPKEINMGTVEVHYFSDEDIRKYGTDVFKWHQGVSEVMGNAQPFREEYEAKHGGTPDLTGTGLWSSHEPSKQWP